MKSSENIWGLPDISSLADAIRELRYGLRLSLVELGSFLGVNPASVNRYEANRVVPPDSVLWALLRLSLHRGVPFVIVRVLSAELANRTAQSQLGVLLSGLITIEGPDAPRHVAKLAKRAQEILAAE